MENQTASEIEQLLEPGEEILWSGRPHYGYFRSEAWAAFVLGILLLAAASGAWFILAMLILQCFRTGEYKNLLGLPIVLLPALGFSYLAASALATPWLAPRKLGRARYAVTDRRVIVLGAPGYCRSDTVPTPHKHFYSFTREQVRLRTKQERQGSRVDIVLDREQHSGGRGRTLHVDLGILGAKDWHGAENAMRKMCVQG